MTKVNRVELVKKTLPDAIRRTERNTFLFELDGEIHAHPTYASAAIDLAREVHLENAKLADIGPIWQRLGKATPPAPASQPEGQLVDGHDKGAPLPRTRAPAAVKKAPRSIRVELPQTVLGDLVNRGRAKVIFALRR